MFYYKVQLCNLRGDSMPGRKKALVKDSAQKPHKTQKYPAIQKQNLTSAFLMFDRFDTIRLTYGYDVFTDRKTTLA